MQTRGGGGGRGNAESRNTKFYFYLSGGEMPSYSAYSSPPSSNQNPSFYRITRYFLFFFPLLTHPACTKKQKEIFKGIRARKLYSSAAIPSKNVCTNICRGKQILFRRCVVVAFTRNVQSRYAAVPFKVVSRKTQDCRNMKHGFCL